MQIRKLKNKFSDSLRLFFCSLHAYRLQIWILTFWTTNWEEIIDQPNILEFSKFAIVSNLLEKVIRYFFIAKAFCFKLFCGQYFFMVVSNAKSVPSSADLPAMRRLSAILPIKLTNSKWGLKVWPLSLASTNRNLWNCFKEKIIYHSRDSRVKNI